MTEPAAAPFARRDVARRAAVTALLVVACWALQRVPAPFLAPDAAWRPEPSLLPAPLVSVLHVGLWPVVLAFAIVELVALVAPRLRARRHGSAADRAALTRAAWFVAIALAAYEALRTVEELAQVGTSEGIPVLSSERLAPVVLALTLVAGTALLSAVALAIGRHGLGNGFAVVLGADLVAQLLGVLQEVPALARDAGVLVPLLLEVAALAVALRLMRGGPGEPGGAVRVPVPTCGLVPWLAAQWVMQSPPRLGRSFLSQETWDSVSAFLDAHRNTGEVAVSVALAIVLARLFSARSRVAASWSAAGLGAAAAPDAAAASARAHRASIALVAFGAALPFAAAAFRNQWPWVLGVFGPVMAGATVMDLAAEARARRRLGPLVPAFALHRVYAVEPALAALAQAGIPAAARARYFRALFHAFAPFAPVELLVPAPRAQEAAAICARIARPELAAPAAAEVTLP
ncbi:MAG TPA: hypothetical protein VEB43_14265 [Anaeromyxobacter sp.]|nr:hypothetical protein [Anaeromyxobacter sp.]